MFPLFQLQVSTTDILTFGLNGAIIVIFCILAYLLIKRNRNRFSFALASYFITVTIGLIFNFIYRLVDVNGFGFYTTMNFITISIAAFAGVYLLHFNLLLVYSTKIYSKKKELTITALNALVTFGGLGIIHFFIPGQGIEWSEAGRDGALLYSPVFGYYGILISQIMFIIIIVTAFQIKAKMGDNLYGRKFIRNIIGIVLFDIQLINGFLRNLGLYGNEIALIFALTIIPGAFFLYSGLKKAPENQ